MNLDAIDAAVTAATTRKKITGSPFLSRRMAQWIPEQLSASRKGALFRHPEH